MYVSRVKMNVARQTDGCAVKMLSMGSGEKRKEAHVVRERRDVSNEQYWGFGGYSP